MLALCALRDLASADNPDAIEEYDETYLINKFREGDAWYRLMPTEEDRAAFFACVRREVTGSETDAITKAYRFFRQRIERSGERHDRLDLTVLRRVIVERLAIVEIATQEGDNPHRIFQSLNGTGVRLAEADLLRNYLFMLLPSRAERVYGEVWRPMEQLIGVDNLKGLARLDLQRRGTQVKHEDVYRDHQARLAPLERNQDAIEAQVRDFALRARHYKRLIDPQTEPDAEIRAGLERLGRMGPQTSRPLLMVAYDLRDRELLTSRTCVALSPTSSRSSSGDSSHGSLPTRSTGSSSSSSSGCLRERASPTLSTASSRATGSTGRATIGFAKLCGPSPSSTSDAGSSAS
jgi:hypothetical protein